MKQHLLIVDDNPEYLRLLRGVLEGEERSVHSSPSAEDALKYVGARAFDLILLDVSMPGRSGLELLSDLRANPGTRSTPVIFLTGRQELPDRLAAYSLGADDYILKDVNPIELKAKIEAKLRNLHRASSSVQQLVRGPLRLDIPSHGASLVRDGIEIQLNPTPLEFKLLHFLAKDAGQVFTREQILLGTWGSEVNVFDRTVDAHVSALRKKLGPDAGLIESVPSVGYRFKVSS